MNRIANQPVTVTQQNFLATQKRTLASSIGCLLLIVSSNATSASYSTQTIAASGTRNVSGPTDIKQDSNSSAPVNLMSQSATTESIVNIAPPRSANANSSSTSSASAATGGLHLMASANSSLVNTPFSDPIAALSSSSAYGAFTDSFIVNVANCQNIFLCGAGQHGTMTVAFDISGSLGGSGYITPTGTLYNGGWSGSAHWDSNMSVSGYSSASMFSTQSFNGTTYTGDGSFGLKTMTIEIVFGNNVSMNMSGNVSASSSVGYDNSGSSAESAFIANLGNTIAWGGILGLTDANGNVINDFSAFSNDTGFNYANAYVAAVPVPTAAWLLVSGLIGLLGFTRKNV